MPTKNSIKKYVNNATYHIYNRGVEKRIIFEDGQDYLVFLSYLKDYLIPKDIYSLRNQLSTPNLTSRERDKILKQINLNNFSDEISLLGYCLMPNHFHLIVRQASSNSIGHFINSLCTRYVMYFNKKYKRVGPLFQSVYKAVLIETEEQLVQLSIYIHRNPAKLLRKNERASLEALLRQPSSLPSYLMRIDNAWLNSKTILSLISKSINKSKIIYKNSILGYVQTNINIGNLLIEQEN